MSEDTHIKELMDRNPCSGYYEHGWLCNAWMEERGLKTEDKVWCVHCKTCAGCPGCNERVLKYWGIDSLFRWNPEVWGVLVS